MGKPKAGLHKKISSIFDGVPVPRTEAAVPPTPRTMPAYVPPPPPKASPPKPSPVAAAPVLPQPPKLPPPARMAPPPPATPRQEPAVAPIKRYNLDSEGTVEGDSVRSKIQAFIQEKLLAPKDGVNRKRQLASVAIIPVLCIVLVVVLPRAFRTPGQKSASTSSNPQAGLVQANALVSWKFPEPYAEGLRDPMKPASYASVDSADIAELMLTGIVFSEDRRAAIIGTKTLHEGDKVLVKQGESLTEFLICKITRNAVEYEAEGSRWIQEPRREVRLITGAALN